jgi:hypothetical protein
MPIPDDVDPDALIARLSGPLTPSDRIAFRRAAEAALAGLSCPGPGAAYRAVAALQRDYFSPPADHRASWDIAHEPRVSKLTSARPIEHGRDLRCTRFKLTG